VNPIVGDLASQDTASIGSGAAQEIEFAVGDCALGKVLVARSPTGVCAITFGSTAGEVEQDLAASFSESRIVLNNRRLRDDLAKVLQFIAAPRTACLAVRRPKSAGHRPASFDLPATTGVQQPSSRFTVKTSTHGGQQPKHTTGESIVSKEEDNKAIVGRWFTDFWGKTCSLGIVDELAAPDMLLQYSLHEPRRGREDIKAFMTDFRNAFPDLNFWGAADLIAEGDYVVGRWEGGGTHTGPAFSDFLAGSLPANTGRKMKFTGTTVLKLKDGKILEEIGLDDGVTALQQLGLIRAT
jgi:predicted ester cyclase